MTLWAREEVTWNGERQVLPASVFYVTSSSSRNGRISSNGTVRSQYVPTCAAASSLNSAQSEQYSSVLLVSLAAVVDARSEGFRPWFGLELRTAEQGGEINPA